MSAKQSGTGYAPVFQMTRGTMRVIRNFCGIPESVKIGSASYATGKEGSASVGSRRRTKIIAPERSCRERKSCLPVSSFQQSSDFSTKKELERSHPETSTL